MELRDIIRSILAGLVALAFAVLVMVVLVKVLTGGGKAPSQQIDLGNYAHTDATVTLLVDGPTKVDQDHRQVRISVSATRNTIAILQGYQGTVVASRSYTSNDAAFGAFLQALKLMNFTHGAATPADYRGYCPASNRYVYTFDGGDKTHFTYWTTNCGQGTYKGDRNPTRNLFREQVPQEDFAQLMNGTGIAF